MSDRRPGIQGEGTAKRLFDTLENPDKPERIQLIESMHQIEQEETTKRGRRKKGRRESRSVLSGNQKRKPVPRNHPDPRNHPEPVSPRQKRRNRCSAEEGVYHPIAQGDPSKSGDS
jgi:hypothetical protein